METDSVYYAKHLINWTYGGGGVGSVTKTEQFVISNSLCTKLNSLGFFDFYIKVCVCIKNTSICLKIKQILEHIYPIKLDKALHFD